MVRGVCGEWRVVCDECAIPVWCVCKCMSGVCLYVFTRSRDDPRSRSILYPRIHIPYERSSMQDSRRNVPEICMERYLFIIQVFLSFSFR